MTRPTPIAACVLACCLANASAHAATLTGGGLRLEIDDATGRITSVADAATGRLLSKGAGGLRLFDGATEKRIDPGVPVGFEADAGRVRWTHSEKDKGLDAAVEFVGREDRLVVRVRLANRSAQQRWLEAQVGLPLDFGAGGFRYWDGYGDEPVPVDASTNRLAVNADPVVRHLAHAFTWRAPGHSPGVEAHFAFPFTCVFDASTGVALGIDLDQILGYHSGGVQPAAGAHRAFHYGAKVVLDPGQSQTVTFVAFRFAPEFGWRNCAERVYELYPKHYEPRPDVDPRIAGSAGGVWTACEGWLGGEQRRRLKGGWVWYYAPFQTTGLPVPERGTWSPTRQNANAIGGHNTGYDAYVHRVTDACTLMHDLMAVGFYVYNWRHDYYVARKFYPKAMIDYHLPKGLRPPTIAKRCVSTVLGHNVEGLVPVWPLHPDLFERTVRDYRRIADVYKPDGIAFDDCTGSSPNTFGKVVAGSPGRWFTKFFSYGHVFNDRKTRVCVRRGVAAKVLGDEVHKLKNRDGRTLYVAANTPSDYLACSVTDVALQERVRRPFIKGSPFWGIHLRKMMGRKPICFGMGHRGEKFDRHDYNLFCLHVGATRIQPWEHEAQALLPLMTRLARAGWRAAPAVTTPAELLLSRFGSGLSTFVVAINRGDRPVRTTLRILGRYVGDGRWVFVGHDSARTVNRLEGRDTAIDVVVPAKGFVALEAVARVNEGAGQATVTASRDPGAVHLAADRAIAVPIDVRLPEGARLKGVSLAGTRVKAGQQDDVVRLQSLDPGALDVAYWARVVFLSPIDAVRRFPFYTTEEKPVPAAVVFSNERITPRPEASLVAVRLSSFFALHKAFAKTKSNKWHSLAPVADRFPWIQAKMLEWMQPTEPAVVVTGDAGIPIPEDVSRLVKLGRGVVAVRQTPEGRPVLFVTGPDQPTIRAAVEALTDRLAPYFPAVKLHKP